MEDLDLFLKDWEVTKDRIKHFDDVIIRLRLQGIPIALTIMSLGALLYPNIKTIPTPFFKISAGSLPFLFAGLYLILILSLDLVHYKLLLNSVNHAIEIENKDEFLGTIQITKKITNEYLTKIHTAIAVVIYGIIMIISFVLWYLLWPIPV